MADDVGRQQENRTRLLRGIYEATKQGTHVGADCETVGAEPGLSREETYSALDYLTRVRGWAQRSSMSRSHAGMTAEGIIEVERELHRAQLRDALEKWREQYRAKTIEELQDGLDRQLYSEEKARIARSVLDEKREERGEVATLKREIDILKGELRDKRTALRWAVVAVVVSAVVGLRAELAEFIKWANAVILAAMKH